MPPRVHYGFSTPRHILEKLQRDAVKLQEDVSPDNVFNFVVTAWSLIDWLRNGPAQHDPALEEARKQLTQEAVVQACRDLANASKHFTLRYSPTVENVRQAPGAVYGQTSYGEGVYGEMSSVLMIIGDQTYSVSELVTQVLRRYEAFFEAHNL